VLRDFCVTLLHTVAPGVGERTTGFSARKKGARSRHCSRAPKARYGFPGVVFVTLEDETGNVNVVVWRDVASGQRRELLGSRLMGVEGVLEKEGEVMHLVARRLTDYSALLGQLRIESRDFH
jgi:DNA polymerase III alpha subunit